MKIIVPASPDAALWQLLKGHPTYERTNSRNGPVRVVPTPVTTVWHPRASRVSVWAVRNANPFFHVAEALWMLSGSNDLDRIAGYNARMREFSDDGGVTQPGAYGYRWRKHFGGYDQLRAVVEKLTDNPYDRRVVLTMWSSTDLYNSEKSKDVPCNTHVYFAARSDANDPNGPPVLDMTVCCRSNDAVWGAYGANVVHFSFLHEFVSLAAKLKMGAFYQVSNNMHYYEEREDVQRLLSATFGVSSPPLTCQDEHEPLLSAGDDPYWLLDYGFLSEAEARDRSRFPWFYFVGQPLLAAWKLHKAGKTEEALHSLGSSNNEWLMAGRLWLQRKLDAKKEVK